MPNNPLPSPEDVRTPIRHGNLDTATLTSRSSIPAGPAARLSGRSRVAQSKSISRRHTSRTSTLSCIPMKGQDGKPEKVEGQYTIYDTKPGDPGYSPLWRHNYVIVPRDYRPQTLRSKEDVLRSGYPIEGSDKITN